MIEPRGKYKYVKKGLPKETSAHRLILHNVNPQPNEEELVVHHIDGDKGNNSLENLQWMTRSEHSKLHHLGENHFPCNGENNANYRHGMCVGGHSKEYKQIHNRKAYLKNREERLVKQNAYGAEHREHKRWYDKLRYWEKKLVIAKTEERRQECFRKIKELKEKVA